MSISGRRLQRVNKNTTNGRYNYSFEGNTTGASVSTVFAAPGDTRWTAVGIGAGSTFTYDTTHVAHGTMAGMIVPAATETAARWSLSSTKTGALRFYMWWDANPTANTTIVWLGGASRAATVTLSPNGAVRLYGSSSASAAFSTADGALPLGAWCRVEVIYQIDTVTPANSQLRLVVYSGENTTPIVDSGMVTVNITAPAVDTLRIGKYDSGANTSTFWLDSVALAANQTSLIGPVVSGGGQSTSFNPGSLAVGTAAYPVPAGALYVAKNGSDTTGTGTLAAPYATIKRALAVAPANSTVVVRAGEYHEGGPQYTSINSGASGSGLGQQITVANAGVTLQNYPNEEVWFDGATTVTNWTADTTSVPGTTVWRTPFSMTVNRAPTEVYGETASAQYGTFLLPEFPIAHWPEMVIYDGEQLQQVDALSKVGPGKFFVEGYTGTGSARTNDFTSTHYVIGSNPSGHRVKIADLARVLGVSKANFTMRGIGVRNYNSCMPDWGTIYVSPSGTDSFTMENCVVRDISTRGMKIGGLNNVIRRCTFYRCGQIAIGNSSDGHIIEHTLFEECNNRRFNYGPDAGAMKTGRCQQGVIRYNWFKKTYGHACWLDEVAYQTVVHGNLFTDTYGNGCMAEISDGNLIVDNIFVNNGNLSTDVASRPPYHGQALRISGSDNCVVWHNTFYNCEVPFRINQDSRVPYASGSFGWDPRFNQAWYQANCTWNIDYLSFGNNALLGSPAANAVQAVFMSFGQAYGKTSIGAGTAFATGNIYSRFSATQPARFAMSFPDGTNIKIYSSLTSTGSGTYDPTVSWRDAMGEQGSVLTTNATPLSNTATYEISPALLASSSPATPPAQVQALLDVSPFIRQSVGAGHL